MNAAASAGAMPAPIALADFLWLPALHAHAGHWREWGHTRPARPARGQRLVQHCSRRWLLAAGAGAAPPAAAVPGWVRWPDGALAWLGLRLGEVLIAPRLRTAIDRASARAGVALLGAAGRERVLATPLRWTALAPTLPALPAQRDALLELGAGLLAALLRHDAGTQARFALRWAPAQAAPPALDAAQFALADELVTELVASRADGAAHHGAGTEDTR